MSKETKDIRNQLNLIMDCFEYCCDKIDSYEDESEISETINHDILIPALKDSLLNALNFALWGDLPSGRYADNRRMDCNNLKRPTISKQPRSNKVDVDFRPM